MKYTIECVSNVMGYVTTEVVEILDCRLDAAIEHFKNEYGDDLNVETKDMYEVTDGKFYQYPVLTTIKQDGDNWQIYQMPLWVSE